MITFTDAAGGRVGPGAAGGDGRAAVPAGDRGPAADPTPGDPPALDPPARPEELERLGEEIARLSAHISAATYRLLCLIRTFDEGQGWYAQGFRSCAAWLSWRTGIAPGAAREKLRVARALARLPRLSEALRTGTLSYSAARALTRIATPETEAELVEVAKHTTAADLERLVRGWRTLDRVLEAGHERRRHRDRRLTLLPAADGSWRIRGRLDPEVGAVLQKALRAAEELLYRTEADERRPGDGSEEEGAREQAPGTAPEQAPDADIEAQSHPAARWADALGLLAEAALGSGLGPHLPDPRPQEAAPPARPVVVGRAERFQVVLHVSPETLATTPAAAESRESRIEHGPHVSPETARRLACDATRVRMTHGPDGRVLDVGRRSRTVPPALRRALHHRDRTCRFPGCTCRFCDAHHLRPWADGGPTKLDNLVLLCRRHHRLLHEEGWRAAWAEDPHHRDEGRKRKDREDAGAAGRGSGRRRDASSRRRDASSRGRELRFYRPDGRFLPPVPGPPELPEALRRDPAAALQSDQKELGIHGWTPTPHGWGDPLDLDWALFTLHSAPGENRREPK